MGFWPPAAPRGGRERLRRASSRVWIELKEQHDKFDVERLNKPEYTISDEVEAEVQAHPSDCGIHMLKFARSVIDDEWKEKTANDIRLHILMNIWSGQI